MILPFGIVLANISRIIAARVLGRALIYALNDTARDALVRDITACNEDFELGGLCPPLCLRAHPRLHVNLTTKRLPSLTPIPMQTLLRDNYRCVFTGKVDFGCLKDGQVNDENATPDVMLHISSVNRYQRPSPKPHGVHMFILDTSSLTPSLVVPMG
ncbi:hypothetical protein BN946_scf184847.g20 [Trametes cinnabarina]|uniref:Uncharacterized protein n=1 Tax=Pycnoporus cinnabarinus TaxID=5643 RepID=A0A060SJN8_PYCCI|nr:hypothetical protein BN946_scf184847.g20 [Trametes cinnabarina]